MRDKLIVTMAMAIGLIGMLIKSYAGSSVVFFIVFIYLVLDSMEDVKRLLRKRKGKPSRMANYYEDYLLKELFPERPKTEESEE